MGQRSSRPSITPRARPPVPHYDAGDYKPLPQRVKWGNGMKPFIVKEEDPRTQSPPTSLCFSSSQRDIHFNTTFQYLTLSDLCHLSCVNVFFYNETTSDRVWLKWLRRDFSALRCVREPNCYIENDDDIDEKHVKKQQQHDDKRPVLSETDEKALLQAIRSGDVVLSAKLASEAASRAVVANTGKEPFIAPVDPLLAIFQQELGKLPVEERILCTAWDSPSKSAKQHYEDEIRHHYDPCLTSPQALAAYLQARPELIDGLTAMCKQPSYGSAMEIKTRGLRETWPNVELSCRLHFDYLRSFYWSWHGIKLFGARIDHDSIRAIEALPHYEAVVTHSGDIEFHIIIEIPSFSNDKERNASIASGIATYHEILNQHHLIDLLGGKQFIKVVQVIQTPRSSRKKS